MPISREAFLIRLPESIDGDVERDAEETGEIQSDATQNRGEVEPNDRSAKRLEGSPESKADRGARANESVPEASAQPAENLPAIDAPSAGVEEGVGPTQPKTEARRSVATGRDAPQAPEIADGEPEVDGGVEATHAQAQVIARRLHIQRQATTEHLTRIYGIVERVLELTEAHLFEGEQKLQSLEDKLDRLEMRSSVNRYSP